MKVVITEAAKADLISIGDFISQDSPHRAASFTEGLLQECEKLTETARSFPVVPRYKHIVFGELSKGITSFSFA